MSGDVNNAFVSSVLNISTRVGFHNFDSRPGDIIWLLESKTPWHPIPTSELNSDSYRQINTSGHDNIVFPAFPREGSENVVEGNDEKAMTRGPLQNAIVAVISNIGEEFCNATIYYPADTRSYIENLFGRYNTHWRLFSGPSTLSYKRTKQALSRLCGPAWHSPLTATARILICRYVLGYTRAITRVNIT